MGSERLSESRPKGRSGLERRVEGCGLPPELADLVLDTVRRTRLWRGERWDVAEELIAHFGDGMAAGRSPARLAAAFGDPAAAAVLITRGRRRIRPPAVRIAVLAARATAAVAILALLIYAVSAVRLYSTAPAVPNDIGLDAVAAREAARVRRLARSWLAEGDGEGAQALRSELLSLFDRIYSADGHLSGRGLRLLQAMMGKVDPGVASLAMEPAYFAFPAERDEVERELDRLLGLAGTDRFAEEVEALRSSPLRSLRFIPLAVVMPAVAGMIDR